MSPQPPARIFAAVGKERPGAGLVCGALLVGFHPMIFERGEQELRDLHAAVAGAMVHADAPERPVAAPEQQHGGEQPEQRVGQPRASGCVAALDR